MKTKITAFILTLGGLLLISCASRNPQYTPILPGQPETNTVPQFIADPRIATWSNAVNAVSRGAAPINPYAGITDWAINGIFGAIGAISLYVARQKSGALNSMASAVVQSGAHTQVLDAAGNTPHFTAIADALNSNLGANQALTNAPTPPPTKAA